jgi:hypothetical protein
MAVLLGHIQPWCLVHETAIARQSQKNRMKHDPAKIICSMCSSHDVLQLQRICKACAPRLLEPGWSMCCLQIPQVQQQVQHEPGVSQTSVGTGVNPCCNMMHAVCQVVKSQVKSRAACTAS